MQENLVYAIGSVVIVSLISFVGAVSLFFKEKTLSKILLSLVSLSAGTLLGGAFFHLLPEVVETQGFTLSVSFSILAGLVVFFIIEKIIHMCSCSHKHHDHNYPLLHESHKHHLGIMNIIGDGLHNLIDGLVIAGAYLVSIHLGIATTVAVVWHEIPQEMADFGVLLYSGLTKKRALIFNFGSAAVAIVGTIIGFAIGSKGDGFVQMMLPFAAGSFLYIAGANLIPELHRKSSLKESIFHLIFLLVGIGLMFALTLLE